MILEIRLKNLFSIKDEIVLDLQASDISSDILDDLEQNCIDSGGTRILKSVGIFGANASGKSNIIKAIGYCRYLILNSHTFNTNYKFSHETFKLDENSWSDTSSFFIRFISHDIEYEYSFSFDKENILTEKLYYHEGEKRITIFERNEKSSTEVTKKYNEEINVIINPWEVARNTSSKTLFISRASNLGNRPKAEEIYSYFAEKIQIGLNPPPDTVFKEMLTHKKEFILNALQFADNDIVDIKLSSKVETNSIPLGPRISVGTMHTGIGLKSQREVLEIIVFHRSNPTVPFSIEEESEGTRRLLIYFLRLFDIIKNNKILIFDEIDLNLHTKIVEFVISFFHAGKEAQFIFTSHNTNLLDLTRFRKDQLYFVNKQENGSTDLYSLVDFEDWQDDLDPEKAYLNGRFDAIPIIDDSVITLKSLIDG